MPNQVEMFIDQQTLTAMLTGSVQWLEPTAWRANGLDNSLFPSGIIPFKGIRLNNTGDPVHDVAAKYYALAHRRNHVEGPPVALLQLSLPHWGICSTTTWPLIRTLRRTACAAHRPRTASRFTTSRTH